MKHTSRVKESEAQSEIKDYLDRIGWVVRVNSGKIIRGSRAIHLAPEGTPDLIGCVNGRFIAVEVKRDEKELWNWMTKSRTAGTREKAQRDTLAYINRIGGIGMVACNAQQVKDMINEEKIYGPDKGIPRMCRA